MTDISIQLKVIQIENPESLNMILGQSHFVKTVEDIHEAIVATAPGMKFGLAFGSSIAVEGSDATFTIATTRPELLPACVGVTAHPEDERYKPLFGKKAVTPLFHAPVPIFPSEMADPEKGTGVLMVCTFGDATDVQWWREEGLALKQILGRNGRLIDVEFTAVDMRRHQHQLFRAIIKVETGIFWLAVYLVFVLAEPEFDGVFIYNHVVLLGTVLSD